MLDISYLRELYRKEQECFELVKLERDFYKKIKEIILKKQEEVAKRLDFTALRELEYMKELSKALCEKRKEKLVTQVVIAGGTLPDNNGLTDEEMCFVEKIITIYKENLIDFDNGVCDHENKSRALEDVNNNGSESKESLLEVKILEEVEPYKGFDGKIYGPYVKGEVVRLPKEEVEFLIESGMAKPR